MGDGSPNSVYRPEWPDKRII